MPRVLTLVLALMGVASPALADFCMLTQNALHLGWGAIAYKDAKRAAFQGIFGDYDVVALQEVMDPAEPARLAPHGFTATISAAKGKSSYREHYAMLTRDAAMRVLEHADYPDAAESFARPPFGVAVEDKDRGRFWLVAIHAVFGSQGLEPRRQEVSAMAQVVDFYSERLLSDGTRIGRVVVAGDWNLPATDDSFAALEQAIPGTQAAPNLKTSLNMRGEYASPYDHFVWNRQVMSVDFAAESRETGGFLIEDYRKSVSDHAGVAGYVMAEPTARRPQGVVCPPLRGWTGS